MAHIVLIILHGASAGVALIVGGIVIRPWIFRDGGWWFQLYLCPLAAMVVFVVAVLAVDWTSLSWTERGIFSALTLLDLYMIWRARRARVVSQQRPRSWQRAYVGNVGFTLC